MINRYVLAFLLLACGSIAEASDDDEGQGQGQGQGQAQGQGQGQSQGQEQQNALTSNVSNTFKTRQNLNAPSANAPSVTQVDKCPIVSPTSSAFSVFILSTSKTTGTVINPICVAWHLGQKDIVQQMACDSPAYREAAAKLSTVNGTSNYCK